MPRPRDPHRKRRTKGDVLEQARQEGRSITAAEGRKLFAPKAPTEHTHQVHLANWVKSMVPIYPAFRLFAAIPNQGGGRPGSGHHIRAALMKAEGLAPGYPDTLLDVARGGWHGLRVELKRKAYWPEGRMEPLTEGEPAPEQVDWHRRLTTEGFCVWVAWGDHAARDIFLWYVTLPLLGMRYRQFRVPDIPFTRTYTLPGDLG